MFSDMGGEHLLDQACPLMSFVVDAIKPIGMCCERMRFNISGESLEQDLDGCAGFCRRPEQQSLSSNSEVLLEGRASFA
jgi:hypothetical protein